MFGRSEVELTIGEMFDVAGERAHRPRRWAAFLAFVALIVVGGLVLSSLAMPSLAVTDSAVRHWNAYWDAFPSELNLDVNLSEPTILLDKDGQEFARFFSEDRTPVTFDQISPTMIDALLAIEDDRFYEHGALDVQGFSRAALVNLLSDRRQGGSTITQQLVENIRVAEAGDDPAALAAAHAQTFEGKLQELKYATTLEENYTKNQILEQYLNTVYFGNGAYGIEAAARRFYGVHASELSLPQAAMLAGLMRSPTEYDPVKHPDAAAARRTVVLKRMVETGRITQAQADQAELEPVDVTITSPPNGCTLSPYPVYCAFVRDELLSDPIFGASAAEREANLYRGGLTITTALDRSISDKAQAAVQAAFTTDNRVVAAEAIVEPGTGHVPAVVQSRDYGQGENQTEIVYATRPSFQPGSSFKMFTLATALEQGVQPSLRFTAATGYKPRNMDYPKGGFSNDGGESFGSIDMATATRKSVNVYFVKLIERVGVLPTVQMARRLGISSIPSEGPHTPTARSATFALGAWEVAPIEMSAAYATIAANGVYCKPTSMLSAVRTQTNVSVKVPDPGCHQALDANTAKAVAQLLTNPLGPGGTAAGLGPGRPAGGKTGTTNDYAATWFVGFTPQFASAVWVGDPRGGSSHPLESVTAYGVFHRHLYGSTVAAPVWHNTMVAIHEGLPVLQLGSLNPDVKPLTIRVLPDVRGMTTSEAFTALLSAGYQVSIHPEAAPPDPLLTSDRVFSQSPTPGTPLAESSVVTIVLTAGSDLNVQAPSAGGQ